MNSEICKLNIIVIIKIFHQLDTTVLRREELINPPWNNLDKAFRKGVTTHVRVPILCDCLRERGTASMSNMLPDRDWWCH